MDKSSVNAKTSLYFQGPGSQTFNKRTDQNSNIVKKVRFSSEAELYDGEKKPTGGEKSAFKIKRYLFINEMSILLQSSVVVWRVGS